MLAKQQLVLPSRQDGSVRARSRHAVHTATGIHAPLTGLALPSGGSMLVARSCLDMAHNQDKTSNELLEQLAALGLHEDDPSKADMRAALLLDLADCAEVRLFTRKDSIFYIICIA